MNEPVRAAASRSRRVGWVAMTVLAIGVAVVGSRYLTLDPDTFLPEQKLVYLANLGPLVLHIAGAVLALALGPWQFVRRLRVRHRTLHRSLGRVYLVSVLATGVGGLLLAPNALAGPVAQVGFGLLAVLVLLASTVAFVAIRRRQVARHREWMVRSYALIFTGVTFRALLFLLPAVGLSFNHAYAVGAWVAWIINLAVAEALIVRSRPQVGTRARISTGDGTAHRSRVRLTAS